MVLKLPKLFDVRGGRSKIELLLRSVPFTATTFDAFITLHTALFRSVVLQDGAQPAPSLLDFDLAFSTTFIDHRFSFSLIAGFNLLMLARFRTRQTDPSLVSSFSAEIV